jgi:sigma-B regulation protein RsbQ
MSDMSAAFARLCNVEVHGTSGPAVVIGGGLGTSACDWAKVVEALSSHCTVVTYATAGSRNAHDDLFSPVRHRHINGFADDLRWLLADLELDDVTFVGHAYIGAAGIIAATADPGSISKLVLLNSSPRYRTEPESGYHGGYSDDEVRSFRRALTADTVAWKTEFVPALSGPVEAITTFEENARGRAPIIATTIASAVFSLDVRDLLSRCTVPTLVLQSRRALPVPPGSYEWFVDHMPGALGTQLDAEGQFPHVTDPHEVIDHVLPFVLGATA